MRQAWAGRHLVVLNWRDLEHPQAGGAEVFAEHVAERLAAGGAKVTMLAGRVPGKPRTAVREGVTIRRAGGTFGVYPAALLWLTARRRRVDAVIDCQNGIPFFSPLVLPPRIPIVQVIHHVHQRQFALFFGRVAAFVGRKLEGPVARAVYRRRPTVSVSPSTRAEVRDVLKLRGPRFLVPNGVQVTAPATRGCRDPAPTIVCVGRLVPHKRLELLLEAMPALVAQVPGLTLHLVGDGPDDERLRAFADSRRLPAGVLVWYGRLPATARDELLARAWLTVNPTHGEGWGLGVMEAAALGIPAVAFRVPGLQDSVRHGITGWLVEENAPLAPAIAAALKELADPRRALQHRQACLDWAARFTWERSADLLAAILLSEERRLRKGAPERRRPEDSATVVQIAGREGVRLRVTDLVFTLDGTPCALLYGADEDGARCAFERFGPGTVVARPADAQALLLAVSADVKARHQPGH